MKDKDNKYDEQYEGVYYDKDDYAGLMRRIIIFLVDFFFLFFIPFFIIGIFLKLPDQMEYIVQENLHIYLPFSYIYLTLIKRSWGTIGYWLAGVKIVNLEGNRPSMWQMTLRFLFLIIGPISFLLDVLWISNDDNRQTLRDKIGETYVIRSDARPTGKGKQKFVPYFIVGWSFMFREVQRRIHA